ncbi:N-formylglutamate amidohydrolase [Chthonobacter albigriseus]|uniref:N-formylglutamate amidohydrolase n=1 Tax=Chthonobacter albigriseus TaxID=1683161 RepID=UPI003140394D
MEAANGPVVIENEAGTAPIVLVVDHASNRIPEPWGTLGLDADARQAHIAWDPGALPLARQMSDLLDAPLVRATVSRLVLDLNRPLTSRTLIPAVSEATTIPGNRDIADADRALRIRTVYEPYHAALAALVDRHVAACQARGQANVAVCAIHTFTPVYLGKVRALEVGVLFDRDDRLGAGMLARLKREPGLLVEVNQPYSPADEVYFTLDRHAVSRGLLNVMIEVRNDELREPVQHRRWAKLLCEAIMEAMGLRPAAPLVDSGPEPIRRTP